MAEQVGPASNKTGNKDGSKKPFRAIGPRCAESIMARKENDISSKEAGYTTATDLTMHGLFVVSSCGRSPYTPC